MKKILLASALFLTPLLTFAQQITNDEQLIGKAIRLGNTFITIIIALSVIYIIWGVFKYLIKGANSEEDRKAGRDIILWGVVGLFVMLSIWGLVRILKNSLATDNNAPTQDFPQVDNIIRRP